MKIILTAGAAQPVGCSAFLLLEGRHTIGAEKITAGDIPSV
jgi:hypothetical protein